SRRFDAKRERRHLNEDDVLERLAGGTGQNRRLDRSAVSHGLVRVYRGGQLPPAKMRREQLLNPRNARRPTSQHNVIDARLWDSGVSQYPVDQSQCGAEEIVVEVLESG